MNYSFIGILDLDIGYVDNCTTNCKSCGGSSSTRWDGPHLVPQKETYQPPSAPRENIECGTSNLCRLY